jgi:hypothetical protein
MYFGLLLHPILFLCAFAPAPYQNIPFPHAFGLWHKGLLAGVALSAHEKSALVVVVPFFLRVVCFAHFNECHKSLFPCVHVLSPFP